MDIVLTASLTTVLILLSQYCIYKIGYRIYKKKLQEEADLTVEDLKIQIEKALEDIGSDIEVITIDKDNLH